MQCRSTTILGYSNDSRILLPLTSPTETAHYHLWFAPLTFLPIPQILGAVGSQEFDGTSSHYRKTKPRRRCTPANRRASTRSKVPLVSLLPIIQLHSSSDLFPHISSLRSRVIISQLRAKQKQITSQSSQRPTPQALRRSTTNHTTNQS